jgi:hypothetical protein
MYLLSKAYALVPSPNLRVYLAEAYLKLGSFLKAKAHLEGFLAESQAWTLTPVRPALVTQARALLADLLPRLVALRIHVNVVGADLFLNGEPLGKSPLPGDAWLMPGASTLVALHPGRLKLELVIDAPRPGVRIERRIELLTPEEGIRRNRLFQEAERRKLEAEQRRLEAERRQKVAAAQLAQARRVEALRVARRQLRLRLTGYVLAGVGVACAVVAGAVEGRPRRGRGRAELGGRHPVEGQRLGLRARAAARDGHQRPDRDGRRPGHHRGDPGAGGPPSSRPDRAAPPRRLAERRERSPPPRGSAARARPGRSFLARLRLGPTSVRSGIVISHQSSVDSRQSTVDSRQSTVDSRQSTARRSGVFVLPRIYTPRP